MREVFPNLFQLRIPLPIPALKHLNAYLIRSEDQYVLIDTGMGTNEAYGALSHQLAEIGVEPANLTGILITHFHIDHVGLVPRLRSLSGAQLVVSAKTTEAVQQVIRTHESYWNNLTKTYKEAGVPTDVAEQMITTTPGYIYQSVYAELAKPSRTLKDGEEIQIGGCNFQTIWTPGHSPGHICLYETRQQFLMAGDHLLPTITPHVTQWRQEGNALEEYLGSLEKVRKLDVGIVLPSHEELFENHRKRIDELKEHHELRVIEILSEIRGQELTAYQVASRIHWDIEYTSWERFPLFQKLLAISETLAHIKLLENQGQVKKSTRAEIVHYQAV